MQLERTGSNVSLMSERRFRSSGGGTRRGVGNGGGSLSSVDSWAERKHGRGGSLDSGVGSYSGDYAYRHQVPPPVPEIPEIYHQNHGRGHQRQMSWQDHQHAPPRNNMNAIRRRQNSTHTHPAGSEIKNCATCDCSCHSSLPTSSTYQQGEVEENYDRLSLGSIPETPKTSRRRYPGEYPHNNTYNHSHNTYSDEEDETIILSPHSEAPRPLPLSKQPSTSSRGYPTRPRTATNESASPEITSPLPKNIFGSLRTSVTGKAPLPTPKGGVKRYPSAGVGVGRSGSEVGSIRGSATRFEMLPTPTASSPDSVRNPGERWGSVQNGRDSIGRRGGAHRRRVMVAGAELSPPQSVSPPGSGHGNENYQRRRRRGSGGSTSNHSRMQLPDSIEEITSPSPPTGGRRQNHHRGTSDHPPPVPALPNYLSMSLHEPPPKSLRPKRQQPYVGSGGGVGEEEPPALKAARDAVGRKKVVAEDEKERINSGGERDVKAGRSKYGVRTERGRKVWVQLEDVEDEQVQPRGLGIFDDGVRVGRQEKVVIDPSVLGQEVGDDLRRHADADGSVALPEALPEQHHHEIVLESPGTPPLTSIPEEQEREQEPVPRNEQGSLKKLVPIPVSQKPISTKYMEASGGNSSSSSSEDDFRANVAAIAQREREDYYTPNPLTTTTTRAQIPSLPPPTMEIPPKPTTETLPPPALNILPSTPPAPEHHDRIATPSPTNESAKVQNPHLRVISTGEIPIVSHDPPPRSSSPRKSIMKQAGVKRDRVGEGRGVQFSESASEIEVVEYEDDESEDEVMIEEKMKKKSSGFASWFRRGGGEKEMKEKAQKKGTLSRRKDKDVVVLGPGTGVAVVSPPSPSPSLTGELLSPVSEGTVGKLSPVLEIKEPEPKPEPEHAVDIQAKPLTPPQQNIPGTFPESSSSASTITGTPTGGSFAGVEIIPLSPSTSRRPPSTCDDADEVSVSGMSIYQDAREEFLPSSPTPVVAVVEDIPHAPSLPPVGLPNMHGATRPSSSSTIASSSHVNVHPPLSILSKSLRSATPTSTPTSTASTSTASTTSTTTSASATGKSHNRNLSSSRSPSPPTVPTSSLRGRYALPSAAITPKTKALMDERRRQIEARKGSTQPHMRPMSESDTETEVEGNWQGGGSRKRRGAGGVAQEVGLNTEGRLLGRASLRSQPHPPHPPPVETTPTKSSFFGFGSGKDKAKEEDKHRLRNPHGHQKKFTSRLSKDSDPDSDSDDESPSGVRGGEFESRFAGDSDSDAVESGEDAGEEEGEAKKEKELAVRRLMEVIAKKKGVALTVDLDAPTGTTVHGEPEEEESEDELVTSNGTVGGEKDRRRRRRIGWGIFKKEPGNQVNSLDDGVGKREPLPVMKAGEREDDAGKEGKEGGEKEGREKEKDKVGKEKGGKFKRMFSRGK